MIPSTDYPSMMGESATGDYRDTPTFAGAQLFVGVGSLYYAWTETRGMRRPNAVGLLLLAFGGYSALQGGSKLLTGRGVYPPR